MQDQASQCVATFSAEPSSATIPPKDQQSVELTLRASRLGRMQLPVHIRTLGSRNKPLQVVLNARSLGPRLEFAPPAALAAGAKSASKSAALSKEVSSANVVGRAGSSKPPGAASTLKEAAVAASAPQPAEGGAAAVDGAPSGPTGGSQPGSGAAASGGDGLQLQPVLEAGPSSRSIGAPSEASGRRSKAATVAMSPSPTPSSATKGRARSSAAAERPADAPPPWQPGASISFDKVLVLQPHVRELRIRNPTVIAAQVKMFIEGTNSVFEVSWLWVCSRESAWCIQAWGYAVSGCPASARRAGAGLSTYALLVAFMPGR